jgi:hypothetical protein
MRSILLRFVTAAACLLPAVFAQADFFDSDGSPEVVIDGLNVAPRVFNNFPGSTLTITNDFPTKATIDDRLAAPGGGANRHDLNLSSDGGTTAHTFDIDDGWTFQACLKLEAGDLSPRKEMGLRVNSSPASGVGDALFIINSDGAIGNPGSGTGEIVAFGGGFPFHSFSNGPPDNYTVGTFIVMGLTYSGDSSSPRTIEYFIDRDPFSAAGFESSGPLVWDNAENGPVDYNLAMYAQWAPFDTEDFITATYCMNCIPEPSTLLLSAIAMIGLAGITRRSKD